jgi:hypothetical protein
MFSTKNVTEGGSNYLTVGVNDDVTIIGLVAVEEAGKSPFVELQLAPTDNKEAVNKFRMYASEKALPYTLTNIKHIATKCVKLAQIDAVEGTSLSDYTAKVNALLANRRFRLLLNGAEYMRQDGTVGVRTELPMGNFAEALSPGAEHEVFEKTKFGEPKIKKLPMTQADLAPNDTDIDWG